MRSLRSLSHALAGCVLLPTLALLGGCSGSPPSGPDAVPAAGGESAPVVASAEPSLVPPGATLDLRVFGSGFDDGSRVDVATGGEPSPEVRTDSTRFVSEVELVATITTAADVLLGPYDIVVTTGKGKQGIGTELIDVDSTSGIQVNTRTTSTSSADQPRGDYDVLIDGAPSGGHRVSPTGSKAVTGLSSGEHSVGLDGVAENCAVSGDNPRTVNVPRGAIVQVFFDIICTPLLSPPSAPPSPPPTTGDVLAFEGVSMGGDLDIYWMTPEGLGPVNLTNSQGLDWGPHWSPDGSQIAFTSHRTGGSQIYVMRADGSEVRQLTTAGQGLARDGAMCPRWSPDGSRIAFGSADGLGLIYVMRADGSEVRLLTTALGAIETCPIWSPDGSKIAFAFVQSPWDYGPSALYVMNSDGTGRRLLSTEPDELPAGNLAWSPDGSRIAYDAWSCPGACGLDYREISIVHSDGSSRVRLTSEPFLDAFGPAWSPDGSKIAFARSTVSTTVSTENAFGIDHDIFVMDANGANLRRLTTDVGLTDVAVRTAGPVWSPDGSRIAFSLFSRSSEDHSIAIMNNDGSDLRMLVTGGWAPAWRPSPP